MDEKWRNKIKRKVKNQAIRIAEIDVKMEKLKKTRNTLIKDLQLNQIKLLEGFESNREQKEDIAEETLEEILNSTGISKSNFFEIQD